MGEPPPQPCKRLPRTPPRPGCGGLSSTWVFLGEWLNWGAIREALPPPCLPREARGFTPSQPTPSISLATCTAAPPIGKLRGSRFPTGAAPMSAAAQGEPSCSLTYRSASLAPPAWVFSF